MSMVKGIFDDFNGYKTASNEDIAIALQNGIVTVDTNVLLDLYRRHPATRDRLFEVFEYLNDRLWISHQTLYEFHRNRAAAASELADDSDKTIDELRQLRQKTLERVNRWINRVGLENEKKSELAASVQRNYSGCCCG
jgi:predicted nucleic acid-binding protein